MKTKPRKCRQGNQSVVIIGCGGYGYNRLEGEAREWAISNRLARSEYCVPVKDGKKFCGEEWQKNKCGDGSMGFSTRRKGQDEVTMEVGQDGQYKKKRNTLVRPNSARGAASRCARRIDGSKVRLVSSCEIIEAMRDPTVVAQQRKVSMKSKRTRNRNNKARRGHKLATKEAA